MSKKSSVVDELGALLAQVQPLNAKIEKLKAKLKQRGEGDYDGALFRATVAVRPDAIVPKHVRKGGLSINVTARNSTQRAA